MTFAGRPTEVKTEPPAQGIRVELVYALPGHYWSISLVLPAGASAGEALIAANSWLEQVGANAGLGGLSVHGRAATVDTALRDGDRLEVLRPLAADPKQSRRDRASATPDAKKS